MLVSRIMRSPVTTVTPDTPVQVAAGLMGALGIGALPVCAEGQLIGIVTDRDIVVRWFSCASVDGPVRQIMTGDVVTCRADQTIASAAWKMADLQIRRLPVLDADGALVGMLSLGDIANDASEEIAGQALGEIVELR
ncbi:CBS domain-containing protein [Rhodobacteraceae bacterium KMM 6894]|nr:CBS domain-containing protein [Rhodobacteraceae bacterium KMM 6894]